MQPSGHCRQGSGPEAAEAEGSCVGIRAWLSAHAVAVPGRMGTGSASKAVLASRFPSSCLSGQSWIAYIQGANDPSKGERPISLIFSVQASLQRLSAHHCPLAANPKKSGGHGALGRGSREGHSGKRTLEVLWGRLSGALLPRVGPVWGPAGCCLHQQEQI